MQCFVCEYDLEPGMLFCINCGQDQRFNQLNNQPALPQPIAPDKYILVKNYPTGIAVPLPRHFIDTRYLARIDDTYIWTLYPDSAFEFNTREEIDDAIALLRANNHTGPMQIIIKKGK